MGLESGSPLFWRFWTDRWTDRCVNRRMDGRGLGWVGVARGGFGGAQGVRERGTRWGRGGAVVDGGKNGQKNVSIKG